METCPLISRVENQSTFPRTSNSEVQKNALSEKSIEGSKNVFLNVSMNVQKNQLEVKKRLHLKMFSDGFYDLSRKL